MFEYTVKSECTALLNRNRKYEGVLDVGFSSFAVPNYLLSHVRVFQIAYPKVQNLIQNRV